MFSDTSGQRLITQNMIADAALFEISDNLTWNSIYELSKFIDVFCLYDRVTVLDRQSYSMLERNTDFFDALKDIVEVREFSRDADLLNTACAHFGTYLGEEEDPTRLRDRLIDAIFYPETVERSFAATPDSVHDLKLGDEWVRTLPKDADVVSELRKERDAYRGTTFLIRTFLYLAYSEVNRVPFTPDAVRSGRVGVWRGGFRLSISVCRLFRLAVP